MSDYLPIEVQFEIIKRLPVKSVLQFRSVCKEWKSCIDGSDFSAAHYSAQQTQLQLLVRYDHQSRNEEHFSIVDDETFPHQKVSLNVPLLVSKLQNSLIMGCDHGLLGMYGTHLEGLGDPKPGAGMAVIWNLSIRKAVAVVVPNVENWPIGTDLGFGVCRETNEPKIVKIKQLNRWWDEDKVSCVPGQVEVFTLSTRAWRSPYSSNLPRVASTYPLSKVAVDGILYWLAADSVIIDGKSRKYKLIVSFDMTSEEFSEINLPDSLAQQPCYNLTLQKLHGSLAVIESHLVFGGDNVVWVMEDCVRKLFTKLFTISVNTPDASIVIARGFRKTGEPIIEVKDNWGGNVAVVLYEPYSKHIKNLGISGDDFSVSFYPYTETLLLLDKPDFMIYN